MQALSVNVPKAAIPPSRNPRRSSASGRRGGMSVWVWWAEAELNGTCLNIKGHSNLRAMAFPSTTQLKSLLETVVHQYGCVIEDIQVARAGAKSSVKIFVDSEVAVPTTLASATEVQPHEFTGPDLDAVEQLSRDISAELDRAEEQGQLNFGPGYTLEVGSAGASAPIEKPRHWVKNLGRLVKLPEGPLKGAKARVAQAAEDGVILILKKGKELNVSLHSLEEVSGARVEIEFSKVPEAEQHLVGLQASAYDAMIDRR